MATYHIIAERRVHGDGDYPKTIRFIACTVEAATISKAQNEAKRLHPNRFSFGGVFGNKIYADADLPSHLRG